MSTQGTYTPTSSHQQVNGLTKDDITQATANHLQQLNQPSSKGIIAVDLDDVLSKTNAKIAEWHNETYGTSMFVNDFYYYYYWKNPYWGTPVETHGKVRDFYKTDWISNALPVDGAQRGVQALRKLGYRLFIVTARSQHVHDASSEWVQRYFDGCFEKIICTGQFAAQQLPDGAAEEHVVLKKLSKAEVCISLGANLLIDDSMENAMACANHVSCDGDGLPPPVVLFGNYQWNKRLSLPEEERGDMTYTGRVELNNGDISFLEEDVRRGDEGLAQANEKRPGVVRRLKDWEEVVSYVKSLEGL
ncbi:hypothetical protein PAXRUDRAFT_822400 [Paxillus rubicundulus Ve08.2h10]|uniref:Unplaced genomic scaffold scaffold_28, whole genome shotgun sequence n=1 Tax=Paxillus rubicundulus Ve08.2h10 TaxID=930991 RepID=A0A0D0E9W7_9AGAM|nr:hypothetical protein PAXRUDRAFT_822400 [Paxillus rubicundulus Ve08.2h10]